MYEELTKCPNFTLFARKNIFRDFGGVVGEENPLAPPSPTPMAGPQAPHQLNPALIQDVLKVKVKVKGHVIRALSWILGMSYSVIDGLVIIIYQTF